MKKTILFGAGGHIGSAFLAHLGADRRQAVVSVPWSQASSWSSSDTGSWFDQHTSGRQADVVFANGLTSPGEPVDELMEGNFRFPVRVIEATSKLPHLRYLTLGSVLEVRHNRDSANAYFASKVRLGSYMQELSAERYDSRVIHLRLHTLYGGAVPHAHSFLGQIVASLQTGQPFLMSDGRQFRQYHHVDDMVPAILAKLAQPWGTERVVQLNGPETIRLADLATAIFSHFGALELLQVGALQTPAEEVITAPDYPPTSPDLLPVGRPAVSGTISWLETLLDTPQARSPLSDQ